MRIIILASSHSAPLPDTQTFGLQQTLDLKCTQGVTEQLQAKLEANVSIKTVLGLNVLGYFSFLATIRSRFICLIGIIGR